MRHLLCCWCLRKSSSTVMGSSKSTAHVTRTKSSESGVSGACTSSVAGVVNATVAQPNKDCVYCMAAAENRSSLDEFGNNSSGLIVDRENLYNRQPYVNFKYHIVMCAMIFAAIVTVLFITDLKK